MDSSEDVLFIVFSYTGAIDQLSIFCDKLQFFMDSFPFEESNREALPALIYVVCWFCC